MKRLQRLHFLIHGFCYHGMARGTDSPEVLSRLRPYLEREVRCAEQWRSRLAGFSDNEGLVVVPLPVSAEAATAFDAVAASTLGDRCFVLDCPDGHAPEFWSQPDPDFRRAILEELRAALVQRNWRWNKEELNTDLHCLACCQRLKALLREREFDVDPDSLSADGWGASFEGCVTKYTVTLRRMLGLATPIEVNYPLTVPDAPFLLEPATTECLPLAAGLRVFIWQSHEVSIALCTVTSHSLADRPAVVRLPPELRSATVRSKQGIRLWPDPEPYELPAAPMECREPGQTVVTASAGGLEVPASAGFVYRLAKAPAYVFAPPEMPYARFRELLLAAQPAEIGP